MRGFHTKKMLNVSSATYSDAIQKQQQAASKSPKRFENVPQPARFNSKPGQDRVQSRSRSKSNSGIRTGKNSPSKEAVTNKDVNLFNALSNKQMKD